MKCLSRLPAIALLIATSITCIAQPLAEEKERTRLQELRADSSRKMSMTALERAYLDGYGVLEGSTRCGQFFGNGSRSVLEELVINLRQTLINDRRIGIRMFGTFTNRVEPDAGNSYRLFEQAQINSSGAFYKSKAFPSEPRVPNVGTFQPNTRAARALILLHELGHLLRMRDGRWLIPDDGDSAQVSRANTEMVESKCGEQIRGLQ